MRMCSFNLDVCVNFLLQTSHSKGRSVEWVNMWRFKWDECLNVLLQTSQAKGIAPVSACRCVSNVLDFVNCLLQISPVKASSWLLVSTPTHSLENTDCSVLWDVCDSPLLLSEKLRVWSSFVSSPTIEWKANRSVQHNITKIITDWTTCKSYFCSIVQKFLPLYTKSSTYSFVIYFY